MPPFGLMFSSVLSVAIGVITMWSGSIGNIPPGWHLCDGTNGTPDLRDKFEVATGPTFAVGDEGGSFNHDHIITGTGHQHVLPGGDEIETGAAQARQTNVLAALGYTDSVPITPPYYALAYIQYLGT